MNYLIKFKGGHGLIPLIKRGEYGLKYISFSLLFLEDGEIYIEDTNDDETALVILGGRCNVQVGGSLWENLGVRKDVFDGSATCVYVPRESQYKVEAQGKVEIAVCKTLSKRTTTPCIIMPNDVKIVSRGKANWSRTVHDIVDARVDADCMLVGETFSPPGNWSSTPPHKHDRNDPPYETRHEEIYFFRVKPHQGFGIIRLYNDDLSLNETYTVEQNDTVILPEGYHPAVAGPGYELYYLWILAGKERKVITREDPKHAWLNQ